MQTALRIETTVLPGHRVEFSAPELPEGTKVEVTVVVQEQPRRRVSMLEFLKSLPPGPVGFASSAEVDEYLNEERNSWDR